MPPEKEAPSKYRGQMCPDGLALHHPAAETLLQYATGGCPTRTGKPWTRQQINEAIARGNHVSAREPTAREQFYQEAQEKVKRGQASIVAWDDIKNDLRSS